MMGPWGGLSLTPTDDKGETKVIGLRPGMYTVEVEGAETSATATVKALDTTQITIAVE